MIFGTTWQEDKDRMQVWCKANYEVWHRKFAWRPTKLDDSRYVWLEWYETKHWICQDYYETRMWLSEKNYWKRAIENSN